ncbi:hypothetical protein QTP86_022465 [Hemibagrus guttatus]|nr:hypothetical protein QTP86_022465 [Hemibagrus guttatus]
MAVDFVSDLPSFKGYNTILVAIDSLSKEPAHHHQGAAAMSSEPSPPLDIDGTLAYRVSSLLNSCRHRNCLQYLVVWEGYIQEIWSWVNAHHILDPSLFEEFHASTPTDLLHDLGVALNVEYLEVFLEGGLYNNATSTCPLERALIRVLMPPARNISGVHSDV